MDDSAKKKIIVQAGAPFVDNTDTNLPPINFKYSSIAFSVDGELLSSFYMNEGFPAVDVAVTQGQHTFEFESEIRPIGHSSVKSNCKGVFDVWEGSEVFAPYIKLARAGGGGSAVLLRGCSVKPVIN